MRFIYRLRFLMLVGSIVVFTIACVILKIAQAILKTRAETNTCTIRLFDRFDSIRMLLQLFEYSFEVF